ncbi:histidine ammonia-lyase [Salinimicrobium sediminis]|uniref:Histidine ammonia-lyase n=1 Tax=Salinimicrobium sediminis TaxID=1343891 RepID=A0A285X6I7_9FLAO|nr:histidine ammonia-lyase [Salinimicrobium sediminis]SOC80940.1 histidine ammonia-lyase [Salinimicrobium sediminis]
MSHHYISKDFLDLGQIRQIIKEEKKLRLSEESKSLISACREYLENTIRSNQEPIYGINTGFGSLCNVSISSARLEELQENLVRSHACGTGKTVRKPIIKLMLFLKIQSLSYGHSGIRLSTVERLIEMYNRDVLPVIFEQGSLGASGDLAPLAHLSLPLIGEGEVFYGGTKRNAAEVLDELGWERLRLGVKEGLALLNGTQFMTAHGVYALLESHRLCFLADVIGSLSVDAFYCNMAPFDPLVHDIRPHAGQIKTATRIRSLLKDSEIAVKRKVNVQDPYSFRCIPQVHGATRDTLAFVQKVIFTEVNSVTDNPNIFIEEDKIISGGNFHGQPLALALDYLAIAMSELGNISERRTFQLISGERGLPAFLVKDPGLNSGFMITQYSAASLVSQNKQYATPASVDSIVSSNGQEDHVSMGANAATKLLKVTANVLNIMAIELFNSSQALYFRQPEKTSPILEKFLDGFRSQVPILKNDEIMYKHIASARKYISKVHIGQLEEQINYNQK